MKKVIVFIICILVYCIPLGAVVYISNMEEKKYLEDKDFDFNITSYGEIKQIERIDILEYYIVDAKVTAVNVHDITVAQDSKVMCSVDDEIVKGQVISSYNGNDTIADFDGIITNIEYSDNVIDINYYDFNDLVIEVSLPKEKYDVISSKHFTDEEGNKLELLRKSKIISEGMFTLLLKAPEKTKFMYGEEITDYKLYTGTEYNDVLAVEKSCVYKQNNKYFIRKVDESGNYIGEFECKIGFSNEKYYCVSGDEIEEGDYCDSGFSEFNNDGEMNESD